jgi:cell division protein FtsZ
MVEYHRNPLTELSTQSPLKTCIVGVGGAGGSVLDRITMDRTVDATLVTMHTDIRVLSHSMSPVKIQLGVELMRGIGAGGDPELGREAALYSREQIRTAIEGHDIIFICVGLGGGTGSGAAPVVAEIAKSTGALVFLTATMPFSFEGKRRLSQAEDSLKQLQNRTDALILFENNRMGELTLPKDGIQKAFVQADQLIAQSLRAVATIVTTPGLVKLGLDDLTSALSTSNGRCLFGFGEARGQNRGSEALKRALKSPLIDQGRLLHQTKTLLVHIAGGDSLTLLEVDGIMKQLGKNVPDQTHILFGVAVDPKLGESVSVTLISSLGLTQLNTIAAAAPPSEMLPLKERPMPSMLSAVAAKPAPQPKPAPAPEPMEMLFGNEELDQKPAAAPQAAAAYSEPEQPEIFAQETFTPEPEPEVVEDEMEPEVAVEEEFYEEEPEPIAYQAPEPAPAPEPVKPVVRPRIEDFIQNSTPRSNTNLASVVARVPAPAPAPIPEEAPYAPPLNSVAAKKMAVSAQEEQIAFRFGGDEDRGRFKDTEPALAGGEDLDVPTWMRLKRKLKK